MGSVVKQLLGSGGRVLLWRRPEDASGRSASDGILSGLLYLGASFLLSFLMNGEPGHIEWLALPDIVFPLIVLGVSAWLLSLFRGIPGLMMSVFIDMVNARTLILAFEVIVVFSFQGRPGADESIALLQQGFELWWVLAGLVRYGRYAGPRVISTLISWATFFLPWFYLLASYPSTDLWQAEGLDSDPRKVVQAMTEEVFSAQPALLEGAFNDLQSERPGIDDVYYLGIAGNGYQTVHRREVEQVQEILNADFDTVGRSLVLENSSGKEADHPFATHTNIEAAINQMAEIMDTDDDILFLFLSSEGLANQHLKLAQPGLLMADLKPGEIKDLLDSAKITWRIIVVSGCYSGGFIEALHDSRTLVITATDANSEGLGCLQSDRTSWFVKTFFDDALRQTKSIPEAYRLALEKLKARQSASGRMSPLPQIDMGAEMAQKILRLEQRLKQPGGSNSGIRA